MWIILFFAAFAYDWKVKGENICLIFVCLTFIYSLLDEMLRSLTLTWKWKRTAKKFVSPENRGETFSFASTSGTEAIIIMAKSSRHQPPFCNPKDFTFSCLIIYPFLARKSLLFWFSDKILRKKLPWLLISCQCLASSRRNRFILSGLHERNENEALELFLMVVWTECLDGFLRLGHPQKMF